MRQVFIEYVLVSCLVIQITLGSSIETTSRDNSLGLIEKSMKASAQTALPEKNTNYRWVPEVRDHHFLVTSGFGWDTISIICKSITEAPDGGYMVAGEILFEDYHIILLLKYDISGVLIWSNAILDSFVDNGDSVHQTSDGGYIIVGTSISGNILLIKYDASLLLEWVREVRVNGYASGNSVQQTTDGGYVVVGNAYSAEAGVDMLLLKFTASGNLEWARTAILAQQTTTAEYTIQQTTDGGYIIAGSGFSDVLLLKFDSVGTLLWARAAGGNSDERCGSIQETADGGYIVTGSTTSFGAGDYDILLLKYDSTGNLVWSRTTGGNKSESGNSVRQTADGGFIVAGETASSGTGDYDIFLAKYDVAGDLVWFRTIGWSQSDYGNAVRQTPDGGYVVTGSTITSEGVDSLLLKVDANGLIQNCPQIQTGYPETSVPTIVASTPQITISIPLVHLDSPLLSTIETALPYTVFCGTTPPPTPLPTPVMLIPNKMNILFRAKTGAQPDYFTTNLSSDLMTYPNDGQIFYIPKTAPQQPSTNHPQSLFRLKKENNPSTDSMDSLNPNEGLNHGYQRQLSLGYTWNSSNRLDGAVQIRRYVNPITNDHATGSQYDHFELRGYVDEGALGFGYRRFCKADLIAFPFSNNRIDDLITIKSNLAAGGALWEWHWNGMQFINDHDYGRSIQTTLWFRGSNPTEAGDQYSHPNVLPAARHGSPVLEAINDGLIHKTTAMALEFYLDKFGGTKDNPLLYENVKLGKELTLPWNSMPRVAQYDTMISVPVTLELETTGNIQIPWVSLRALFCKFYKFDEQLLSFSNITSEVMSCRCTGNYQWKPADLSQRWGGVVVSTADENYAFGILVDTEQEAVSSRSGSVVMLVYYFFDCPEFGFGVETGQFDNPTTVPIAIYQGKIEGPGFTRFRSYLICGSLAQVQSDMIAVYEQLAE